MSIAGPTAALVTLLAATAPTPSRVTTPVDPVEIYGGEKIGSNEFRAVAAIEFDSVLCTGTVVSETLVLTAAHCLTSLPNVNDMRVVIGDSTTSPDAVAEVERYAIHPDFCDDPDTCEEDFYDFAYVVLKQQLPIAELPLVMSLQEEWDQTMFIDAPITLVGFGRASNGPSGYKRKVETTITAFSKSGVEFKAGGMGKDTCQGDSGGPAFVEARGRHLRGRRRHLARLHLRRRRLLRAPLPRALLATDRDRRRPHPRRVRRLRLPRDRSDARRGLLRDRPTAR